MDQVGLQVPQQGRQGLRDAVQVHLRHVERVEPAAPDQQLVRFASHGLERGTRALRALVRGGSGEEQPVHAPVPAQRAKEVAGEDLGAARLQVGMGVEQEQYAHGWC